jgi:hypothetical protein
MDHGLRIAMSGTVTSMCLPDGGARHRMERQLAAFERELAELLERSAPTSSKSSDGGIVPAGCRHPS